MMNKRGQGLPMNTIIIAIIVIVVLIAIVIFFLGGFRNIVDAINGIWGGQVRGDDQALTITSCEKWCRQAQDFKTDEQKRNSKYCTERFNIDFNSNNKLETNEMNLLCGSPSLYPSCEGVDEVCRELHRTVTKET